MMLLGMYLHGANTYKSRLISSVIVSLHFLARLTHLTTALTLFDCAGRGVRLDYDKDLLL